MLSCFLSNLFLPCLFKFYYSFCNVLSGFNRKRVNGEERLFDIHYERQNSEEFDSTEQLTYAQVQQGRLWHKRFYKDKLQQDKEAASSIKKAALVVSNASYDAFMLQSKRDSIVDTPLHSSSTGRSSTSCKSVSSTSTSGSSMMQVDEGSSSVGRRSSISSLSDEVSGRSPIRQLSELSIQEVSDLLLTTNMSSDLIAYFKNEQVDGLTLSMIASIAELKSDYLTAVTMKEAKVQALWARISEWKNAHFE